MVAANLLCIKVTFSHAGFNDHAGSSDHRNAYTMCVKSFWLVAFLQRDVFRVHMTYIISMCTDVMCIYIYILHIYVNNHHRLLAIVVLPSLFLLQMSWAAHRCATYIYIYIYIYTYQYIYIYLYLIASRIPPGLGGSIARSNDNVDLLSGASGRPLGRLWGASENKRILFVYVYV